MKVRDSGMPEEEWWSTFFDPEGILRLFGLDGEVGDVVEFGCGYGTFTLPAARLVSGTIHALDIEPALVELVKGRCARDRSSASSGGGRRVLPSTSGRGST